MDFFVGDKVEILGFEAQRNPELPPGLLRGSVGTVKSIDPRNRVVWVSLDGADSAVWFDPRDLRRASNKGNLGTGRLRRLVKLA